MKISVDKDPSPTPPHKGEGLPRSIVPLRWIRGVATSFLPPCGGDGRQARRGLFSFLLLFLVFLTPLPAFAVNPDEVLSNPALEQRARNLSAQLRCMVCQNQSIDDSNAELARDLRVLVRERLANGDTDDQVIDYVVSRYGEFVLLKPRLSAKTMILWATPVLLLLVGGVAILVFVRTRPSQRAVAALSAEEQARIEELLKK
ncbi:Cytochrome c-type biogenesis protein CycL [Neorhizobium galegae bv. officinalis]|uniref:Cytochrome c-type biogenesis protein n=1 Tax=Neorhizobium galegae bv. officinalis TaxID=323656 RepID=A0A0T7FV44_NEOGA|nr:Cytochrome c-type biogenesis protein CycL [Neorhizobium galegae bv. officinalis]